MYHFKCYLIIQLGSKCKYKYLACSYSSHKASVHDSWLQVVTITATKLHASSICYKCQKMVLHFKERNDQCHKLVDFNYIIHVIAFTGLSSQVLTQRSHILSFNMT